MSTDFKDLCPICNQYGLPILDPESRGYIRQVSEVRRHGGSWTTSRNLTAVALLSGIGSPWTG